MTSASRSALATLTLVAALIVGGEVVARRVTPLPAPLPDSLVPAELVSGSISAVPDDDVLWMAAERGSGSGETLDALGLRPPNGDDSNDKAIRILILGDSNAFGLGVPAEQTYAARLQRFFDRAFGRGAFAVKNGAVPGFTVAQGVPWFERRLAQWRPDIVVVAFGNGSELEPAFDRRCDLELLAAARQRAVACPLHAVDAVQDAFRDADDSERFAPARARVNATQFFDTLSTLVGSIRTAGGEPMLLAPTVPIGRAGQEARDTSIALYREAARRVAGSGGTGFVDAGRPLVADANAFGVLSPRLTSRGHAHVASTLAMALLMDRALAERVRLKAEADPHDGLAASRATAVAAASLIAFDGPIGVDGQVLHSAFAAWSDDEHGTPAFLLMRALLDRPLEAQNGARFEALAATECTLPMREFAALRALVAGDGKGAVAALEGAPRDVALHAFVSAIQRSPTAAIEAVKLLQSVLEASPANALALFFSAHAALGAGDTHRATAFVHAAFEALAQDGHDGIDAKAFVVPVGDSDAAAADFLQHEPVLFSGAHREAFLRLFYWSWVCEPLLCDDGHALVRRSVRLGAAGLAVDAQAALAAAIAWAGSDAERNASLGFDLLKRGNVTEAANAFDRSLAAQDSAESRYWRALIAIDAQDLAAALDHLDRAIAADPADGRFHLARGRCLSKLGRYQDAAGAFERALEIWPGSAETIELLEQARAHSP